MEGDSKKLHDGLGVLIRHAHGTSVEKGFWATERNVGEMLMLVTTELAEAMEEARVPNRSLTKTYYEDTDAGLKPVGFASEIADAVIRLSDLCGGLGIPLAEVLEEKLAYNARREHMHGKTA